jgi:hypothetical protein
MGSGESWEELEGLIDDAEDEEEWEIARHYHPSDSIDPRPIGDLRHWSG